MPPRSSAALPADEIAISFDPDASDDVRRRYPGTAIIARLAMSPDLPGVVRHLGDRADAVILDTEPARLLDQATIAELDGFAETCRARNLPFGFQGGLEAPDVARLLLLEPNVLGFDAAVRLGHDPKSALDPGALRVIRSLIPRETEPASTKLPASQTGFDRVFVRDFVIPLSIGAYKAEQDARQRVRFSVEVEVERGPAAPRDMSDVFSYDIIIETIRVRTARAHVVFVEALAEDVAAALLEHAAVRSATVKVEKLDVVDGAVGIEIRRRRDP